MSKLNHQIGKITNALTPLVTEKRMASMRRVAAQRTRQICVVFENTHHAHNISAVLRTMDALGFLDVLFLYDNPHIRFRAHDSIDRSASKWLRIKKFDSIEHTIKTLKQAGYKIALISRPDFSRTATHYRAELKAFSTNQLDNPEFLNIARDNKIALIFGTELYGLSENWSAHADFYLSVDMYGFCESLNISVCAGIILHTLRDVLTKHKLLNTLSDFEITLLVEYWIAKDTPHAREYIENKYPELIDLFKALLNNTLI